MNFVNYMEKKVFFNIIRFFAFCICLLSFVVVVVGAISLITNFRDILPSYDVKVSIEDVQTVVTHKENQKKQEQYNEAVKQELQNAWRAAQTLFRNAPIVALTTESLVAVGFMPSQGIKLDIINPTQQGLNIQGKHEQGHITFSINSYGFINQVAGSIPPATPPKMTKASALDDKIEALISETISIMPQDKVDPAKMREALKRLVSSMKEEYRTLFLQGLIDVLKQAPADKRGEFINQYVELFKERVAAKEVENSQKETKAWVNIATYAGAIGGGIIIIALFGLILVLLAIEKNTRKSGLSDQPT